MKITAGPFKGMKCPTHHVVYPIGKLTCDECGAAMREVEMTLAFDAVDAPTGDAPTDVKDA